MDLATLKAFRPAEFEGAADGYRATGEMATAAKDTVDNQIGAGIRQHLKGDAAEAALRALAELSKNFHYTQSECGLVSTALNGFAFDMAAAKRKLQAALEDARANNCTVDANGAVTYPPGGKEQDGKVPAGGTVTGSAGGSGSPTVAALDRQAAAMHPNPNFGRAAQYADRIADALREAAEADAKWAPKLRALKADDDLVVSDADWVDTRADGGGVLRAADAYLHTIAPPPKDGTPGQNAAWWSSLTAEQRADHLAVHPGAIGALNGLPADIRDEGNRMVLARTRAAYQLELNGIPPEPTKFRPEYSASRPSNVTTAEWREWNSTYGERKGRLENVINGIRAVEDRFDRTGVKGLPEAYLLGFDPTGLGDGRVILANGNPDRADHVAVYVPGTHAGIEGIGDGVTWETWGGRRGSGARVSPCRRGRESPRSPGSTTTPLTASSRRRRAARTRTREALGCTTSCRATGRHRRTLSARLPTPRPSATAMAAPWWVSRPSRGVGGTPKSRTTSSSPAARASRQTTRRTWEPVPITCGRWVLRGTTRWCARAVGWWASATTARFRRTDGSAGTSCGAIRTATAAFGTKDLRVCGIRLR